MNDRLLIMLKLNCTTRLISSVTYFNVNNVVFSFANWSINVLIRTPISVPTYRTCTKWRGASTRRRRCSTLLLRRPPHANSNQPTHTPFNCCFLYHQKKLQTSAGINLCLETDVRLVLFNVFIYWIFSSFISLQFLLVLL